jgi:phage terminase large subunit-like protein
MATVWLLVVGFLLAFLFAWIAMAELDYCDRAKRYARSVVKGNTPACEFVQLACERQLRDIRDKLPQWTFEPDFGNRICTFIERLPHPTGRWPTKTLVLEDWQCFVLTTLFGWVDEHDFRRYTRGYVEIPRKNAKTTLAAGVGLYLFAADGEPGAEVYSAAVSRDQAKHTWSYAKVMVQRRPRFRAHFGLTVYQHHLEIERTHSIFRPLARDVDSLEGLNVSGGIVDELHAHKTREVYDVLDSATGSRRQPLLLSITTAGSDATNIGGEQHDYAADILRRLHTDERYFGIIYTIDKGEDWTTLEAVQKANPNYNVSVLAEDLESHRVKALKQPTAQSEYQRKRLCIWGGSAEAYFNLLAWQQGCRAEISLEEMEGKPCWFALDLASKSDIAALMMLFKLERRYALFGRYYLPEETIRPEHPNRDRYSGWLEARENFNTTGGNLIDFEVIEEDLKANARRFRPREIGFDPWNATELGTRMLKEGLKMVQIPMTVKQLSEPMKTMAGLILDGRLLHDGDPVLSWMVGNVTAQIDRNENVFPRKEKPEKKIDAAVGAIMALSRAQVTPARRTPRWVEEGPVILNA